MPPGQGSEGPVEKGQGGPNRGYSMCKGRGGIHVLESLAAGYDPAVDQSCKQIGK